MIFIMAHACRSDIGLERSLNEDACYHDPERGLWLVLDGMGGHGAGDLASRLAGEALLRAVGHGDDLIEAMQKAHHEVLDASQKGQGTPRMGCTCVALMLDGLNYTVSWLGDCRAYLWNRELKRLTKDHTYVQELVDAGLIKSHEAFKHPQRNIVTRALGGGGPDEVHPGIVSGRAEPEQRFLLCSDGLSGEVPQEDIESILELSLPEDRTVDRLIDEANHRGGRDNITVALVTVPLGRLADSIALYGPISKVCCNWLWGKPNWVKEG